MRAVPQKPEGSVLLGCDQESVPQPPSMDEASLPTTRNQDQSEDVSGEDVQIWLPDVSRVQSEPDAVAGSTSPPHPHIR